MAQQAPKYKNPGFSLSRRIANAKVREFALTENFKAGYRNREDKTKLPPGILIEGSQNVLTDVFNRVGITKGYTLDGQSSQRGYLLQENTGFLTQENTGLIIITN